MRHFVVSMLLMASSASAQQAPVAQCAALSEAAQQLFDHRSELPAQWSAKRDGDRLRVHGPTVKASVCTDGDSAGDFSCKAIRRKAEWVVRIALKHDFVCPPLLQRTQPDHPRGPGFENACFYFTVEAPAGVQYEDRALRDVLRPLFDAGGVTQLRVSACP